MRSSILIIFCAVLVISCSRPSSYEPFILRENAEYGDTYSYNLDLSDSLSAFSLNLYTRLERKAFKPFAADSLELSVKWISPSDSIIAEDIVIHLAEPADSSYFNRDFICPFKEEVLVPERGVWRLRIQVQKSPDELRGLGVILRRK